MHIACCMHTVRWLLRWLLVCAVLLHIPKVTESLICQDWFLSIGANAQRWLTRNVQPRCCAMPVCQPWHHYRLVTRAL
jgi:hypothetical protein